MGKTTEAITALTKYLDVSPTDSEAWAEISDLYISQGMYAQGIFALEEVLLIAPNAWNVSPNLIERWYSADVRRYMLVWARSCTWLHLPTILGPRSI